MAVIVAKGLLMPLSIVAKSMLTDSSSLRSGDNILLILTARHLGRSNHPINGNKPESGSIRHLPPFLRPIE